MHLNYHDDFRDNAAIAPTSKAPPASAAPPKIAAPMYPSRCMRFSAIRFNSVAWALPGSTRINAFI